MARMIRTEYIEGLRKILAFKPPVQDEKALVRLTQAVTEEAKRDLEALMETHPPKQVVSVNNGYIRVDYLISDEVERARNVWLAILRQLFDAERELRWGYGSVYSRASATLQDIREHARVQLAWAEDLQSATVNLTKADHAIYETGLHVVESRSS